MSEKHVSAEDSDGPVRRLRSGNYRDILDVDQVNETSGSQQGGKLKPFWDAMSKRVSSGSPVDVLVIGDSIMTNETAVLNMDQRVIEVFRQQLTQKFGGGYGQYYQCRGAGGLYGNPWTVVGHTAGGNFGLGQNCMLVDADADLATLTTLTTCDRVLIAYRANAANAGSMRINVDGGANIDITTTGLGDTLWDSGPLTPGVHTVTVKRVPSTGGSFILEGAMIEYGCRNPGGIRMWDSAHSGIGAVEFGADVNWTSTIGPTKIFEPDLIVMSLGENDVSNGEPAFSTSIDLVIAALLGVAPKATCGYIMHTPWGFANQMTDTIAPINASIRTRCTNNGFVVADMHAWLKHFLMTDDGFTFDGVHPWGQGIQMIVRSFMYSLGLAKSPQIINMHIGVVGDFSFIYPEGSLRLVITAQAGGAGGGAGRRGAAGTVRCGGGGGGAGGRAVTEWDAAQITNDGSWNVHIGSAGAGGVATTVNDTNGAAGNAGGPTWLAPANDVQQAQIYQVSGTGGAGGTASAGAGGTGGGTMYGGGTGGAASTTGGIGVTGVTVVPSFTGGGGSGGGITSANVYGNGGKGGDPGCGVSLFITAFGVSAGVDGVDVRGWCSTGAGGGTAHATTPTAGGNGGKGSGGGGGPASLNGIVAPKGGDGGAGYFHVVCHRYGDVV